MRLQSWISLAACYTFEVSWFSLRSVKVVELKYTQGLCSFSAKKDKLHMTRSLENTWYSRLCKVVWREEQCATDLCFVIFKLQLPIFKVNFSFAFVLSIQKKYAKRTPTEASSLRAFALQAVAQDEDRPIIINSQKMLWRWQGSRKPA